MMSEGQAATNKPSQDSTSLGTTASHSRDIDSKTEPCGLGTSSGFCFSEVKGDLFSSPDTSSLAHCVSEDLAMGKGVAVLFKRKFGGVAELKAQGVKTGGLAVLKRGERYVYYLVTKPRYFHKPTYETLRSSLLAMKEHCLLNKVRDLCLPRIGCGLDRLQWDRVVAMMMDLFGDVDMNITVYYL